MALAVMRRHRRWLFVFLWLVILAFIILYIPAFRAADTGSPGEAVGRVGDLPITTGEFQKAYLRQRQMYERLYQGHVDAAALKSLGIESQVFDRLVTDRLVTLEARRLGLSVDDDAMAKALSTLPEFQENGHFMGKDEIQRRLEAQGISVEEFEASLRQRLLHEKLEALVTDAVAVPPADVEQEFRRRTEQVRVEYVQVDEARFRAALAASDDEVKARFAEHKDDYKLPEKRVVSFLLVDPDALQARVTVTDADTEAYYNEHKDEYRQPEEACASHILVKVKEGEGGSEGHPDAEAKALAQQILAKLKAGGDFAQLAKASSEDKGSAEKGGDLGCFGRGRMVQEFENAVFALDPGQTSELVRSPFGYHIVRLTARHEEALKPLTEVKDGVRQSLLRQRVATLANEKAQAVADALRKGRSLEEAGKADGLPLQKSPAFARGESPRPLSAAVVARAFELKVGEVEKEPFSAGRGGFVFVALAEIQPPRVPELKEVEGKVKADLLGAASREKARQLAVEVQAAAGSQGLEKAATAHGLVRKETPTLVGHGQPMGDLGASAALEEAAYALPEKTLSEPVRTPSGWALMRVIDKRSFDPAAFEKQRASIAAQMRQQRKGELFQAYMSQARQRVTVEKSPEAFRKLVG
jgi:peptidyl-prolyl cis-trans isomerase D